MNAEEPHVRPLPSEVVSLLVPLDYARSPAGRWGSRSVAVSFARVGGIAPKLCRAECRCEGGSA
jgi:hypothetical protein